MYRCRYPTLPISTAWCEQQNISKTVYYEFQDSFQKFKKMDRYTNKVSETGIIILVYFLSWNKHATTE